MDKSKVDMFLMTNGKNFPVEKLLTVKDALEKLDDDKFMFIQSLSIKDNTTTLLLGILLGADRIYLGQVGLGIFKIISMFFFVGLIWLFIDLFSLGKRTKEYNFQQFSVMTAYS